MLATLLGSPYLWHYELAWLGIAVFALLVLGFEDGVLPGETPVIVAAWVLPALEYVNRLVQLPQIGPVVLLAMMLLIVRRARLLPGVVQ